MSRLIPYTPAPFPQHIGTAQVKPLIESVDPEIRTWFNTRDAKIIQTDYNTCNGQIQTRKYAWNIPNSLQTRDIWPCPIQLTNLFWQYGTQPVYRCNKSGQSYIDPN